MKVIDWLREANISQSLLTEWESFFPEVSETLVTDPVIDEWVEGIDEFRFTLEDWVAALLVLEKNLQSSGKTHFSFERKVGYVHCAAMAGEVETSERLPDLVAKFYSQYGMDEE